MKGKLMITAMIGMLCLSFMWSRAEAEELGGLPACQNNLGICTTNLGNAQTNLATCQETLMKCSQTTPPPSWYKKLACGSPSNCPRFEVLVDWDNAAVLDKETGLVWERSPGDTVSDGDVDLNDRVAWGYAQFYCQSLTLGNRKGWRLPTVQELSSLVDPTQSNPSLPSGHPFQNVQWSIYWSANTYITNFPDFALGVGFNNGHVFGQAKGDNYFVWCVRGGQGVDPQ